MNTQFMNRLFLTIKCSLSVMNTQFMKHYLVFSSLYGGTEKIDILQVTWKLLTISLQNNHFNYRHDHIM